jgi:hypothetical protein
MTIARGTDDHGCGATILYNQGVSRRSGLTRHPRLRCGDYGGIKTQMPGTSQRIQGECSHEPPTNFPHTALHANGTPVTAGCLNKHIAAELGQSEATVRIAAR